MCDGTSILSLSLCSKDLLSFNIRNSYISSLSFMGLTFPAETTADSIIYFTREDSFLLHYIRPLGKIYVFSRIERSICFMTRQMSEMASHPRRCSLSLLAVSPIESRGNLFWQRPRCCARLTHRQLLMFPFDLLSRPRRFSTYSVQFICSFSI